MKKIIGFVLTGLGGLLAGAIITGILVWNIMPGMMLIENRSKYDFDKTVELFTQSVDTHNWKIPAVHDLQKSMEKFGSDVEAVKVFELCQPEHANRILSENDERIVSSLMPCRVAIYKKTDGKTYVSRMNSGMMAGMMGGLIDEVMAQAAAENEEILAAVID